MAAMLGSAFKIPKYYPGRRARHRGKLRPRIAFCGFRDPSTSPTPIALRAIPGLRRARPFAGISWVSRVESHVGFTEQALTGNQLLTRDR
jgi:hypothetical protein